jgi:ribosomal-protein-alanine N-acetyltransferase
MKEPPSLVPIDASALDRIAALHAESFVPLGERAWTRQDFAELLATPGVVGWVLSVDDEDMGFALYRIVADEAELLTIAVRPAWRRQGVGRVLLDAIAAGARGAGAQTFFLEVGADNPPARSLYESQGFSVVGTRRGYYRRGDGPMADGLVMRLILGP